MSTITRLKAYARLIRLDKPIGYFLLLWPTLWALLMAGKGQPDPVVLIVFILGVFLMRSAGCAINDFADRHYDGEVLRTQHRPIVTGAVTAKEAVIIFVILSVIAFFLVFFLLNLFTLYFSLVAIALAASYPFTKRFHYLPQVHLGLAFAWAVPMAFVALTNQYPPTWGWLLFTATVVWTTAYDTIYGMVDRQYDIRIGVKSTAILFGSADRLIIAFMQLFVVLALVAVGVQAGLRYWFFIATGAASLFFIYQQRLIYSRTPQRCFNAFLNNNYFGMTVFAGIAASYWIPF